MSGIIFGCAVPHPPIIIPEIGKGEERKTQATIVAMHKLGEMLTKIKPEVLFVISPHGKVQYNAMGVASSPCSEGSFNVWGASGISYRFDNDLAFVHCLQEECNRNKVPLITFDDKCYELDWGVLVPIHFLIKKIDNVTLVPATFSFLPLHTHFLFGKSIRKAAEQCGKKIAFIASGDLSHRLLPGAPAGYDPMGKVFDRKVVEAMSHLDSRALLEIDPELVDRAGECGLRSFTVLSGALDGLNVTPEILSYEGPFGVGYMVASFMIGHLPEEE